jgi:hypothetical protein
MEKALEICFRYPERTFSVLLRAQCSIITIRASTTRRHGIQMTDRLVSKVF